MRRAAALAVLCACARFGAEDAIAVVRAYDAAKIEAYRTGDATRLEPVASARESKKVLALVGVKTDLGLRLDAALESLEPLGAREAGGAWVVETRERWRWRHRKVAGGKAAGEDSLDEYRMRYFVRRVEGRWVVDEVAFAAPPVEGRPQPPPSGDASMMHGVPRPPAGGGAP